MKVVENEKDQRGREEGEDDKENKIIAFVSTYYTWA
jgi:hypothetical protein